MIKALITKVSFDFAVLASCDHNIYDYGTFGFWTSFIAGGEVRYQYTYFKIITL